MEVKYGYNNQPLELGKSQEWEEISAIGEYMIILLWHQKRFYFPTSDYQDFFGLNLSRCGRDGHWSKECPQFPDHPGPSPHHGGAGYGR